VFVEFNDYQNQKKLPQSAEKWRRHKMLPVHKMKLEEWMFIWELKDQTPIGHG
jgi:hypothetical protein